MPLELREYVASEVIFPSRIVAESMSQVFGFIAQENMSTKPNVKVYYQFLNEIHSSSAKMVRKCPC
ncbi:MAG: hypothetical protein ABSG74_08595 [Candidatus Bathyarchaeia archaeon]